MPIAFPEYMVSSLSAFDFSAANARSGVTDRASRSVGQDPLVSVVIPCYNGEAYLAEAIESALTQTYQPVEIIVVDDGSTDSSPQIAQKFPVRYIRQQNQGLTASRNLGIRESRGDYIVFLDADDRLKPEAIETGLGVLAEHPECAMTVGDHVFLSADGSRVAASRKDCLTDSHYEALLKSNFIEMISSVLFRRSVLEQLGGFDTGLRVAEDYELYLRIARDYPMCCHPAVVAEYRLHLGNTSHDSELMLTMTLQVLRSQARYVRGDARRLFAFLEGVGRWREKYGRQLAAELARSFSSLHGHPLRRKLLLLVEHYPQGLMVFLLLRLMPRLARGNAPPGRRNSISEKVLSQRMRTWLTGAKPQSSTQAG